MIQGKPQMADAKRTRAYFVGPSFIDAYLKFWSHYALYYMHQLLTIHQGVHITYFKRSKNIIGTKCMVWSCKGSGAPPFL